MSSICYPDFNRIRFPIKWLDIANAIRLQEDSFMRTILVGIGYRRKSDHFNRLVDWLAISRQSSNIHCRTQLRRDVSVEGLLSDLLVYEFDSLASSRDTWITVV
jgi:hypothetical protein